MALENNNLPDATALETQLDLFNNPIIVPAGKLDADQYAADDIDGVTESLFGSGNLNFLSLQAAQTNEFLQTTGADIGSSLLDPGSSNIYQGSRGGDSILNGSSSAGDLGSGNSLNVAGREESPELGKQSTAAAQDDTLVFNGNESNVNVATASTSAPFAIDPVPLSGENFSGINGVDGTSGVNGTNGTTQVIIQGQNGQDGRDGRDGNDGNNGNNGNNGGDGDNCHTDDCCGCGGDTIINIDIGDTLVNIINNTVVIVGDLVTTIIENITSLTETLIVSLTEILDITEILNCLNITEILNLTEILNVVNNTVTNVTDIVNNLLNSIFCSDGGLNIGLDIDIVDTLLGSLDLGIGDTITGALDAVLDLAPVTGLLNNLTGLNLPILADLGTGIGFDIDPSQILLNLGDINDLGSLVGTLDGILNPYINLDVVDTSEITGAVTGVLDNLGLGDNSLIEEVINLVNDVLDPVDSVINTVENLVQDPLATVGDLLDNPQETIETILGDVTGALGELGDVTGGVQDVLNNALGGGITETLGDLTGDLTGGLAGGLLGGLLGNGSDNAGGTDSDLLLGTDLNILGTGLSDLGIPDLGLDLLLDPIEDLVGDIDLGAGLGLDLFGNNETSNAAGDTDITLGLDIDLLGTDLLGGGGIEIPLDPLEALVGDIDLDLGAATNILGDVADNLLNGGAGGTGDDTLLSGVGDTLGDLTGGLLGGLGGDQNSEADFTIDTGISVLDQTLNTSDLDLVLDPVEGLLGDIGGGIGLGTDLLGDSETSNAAGDTDIVIDLDINIAGIEIPDIELDIPLDPVESILGDIDLDITTALDLLGNGGGDCSDGGLLGGGLLGGITGWTESVIPDGGGLFGDIVNGIGGETDCLPEPVTSIVEGLGALPIDDHVGSVLGKLGGLFG